MCILRYFFFFFFRTELFLIRFSKDNTELLEIFIEGWSLGEFKTHMEQQVKQLVTYLTNSDKYRAEQITTAYKGTCIVENKKQKTVENHDLPRPGGI